MRRFTAIVLTALVLLSATGGGLVAAATTINYDSAPAQSARVHEDVVTIAEHDRTEMSDTLAYYDDSGEVATLPATINESETAPVQVHLGEINESQYREFPRLSRENGNNTVTWLKSGNWTTATSASGGMTITETSPAGDVQALTFDATATAAEWGEANFTDVDIKTDATKRVPLIGVNVDTLATGSVVDIRFVDADDDYVALEINETAANASVKSVITNTTGEAYIAQQRLSELPVEGSGDGSLDEIQKVWIRVDGGNAKIELFALDAESKSAKNIARAYHNHDGKGTGEDALEWETIQTKEYPGYVNMSSVSDLGTMYDTAVIYDKKVRNVFYPVSFLTGNDTRILTSDAEDYPSFDKLVNASYRLEVPAPIDVSHGTLTLEAEQSLVGDRYVIAEYATDVGDTDFENITYTNARSSFTDGKKGDVVTLASNVNAGVEHAIHFEIVYTSAEFDALMSSTAAAGGPVGSGSGGLFGGFFNTAWGWVVGIVASVGGFLGLRRVFGGG